MVTVLVAMLLITFSPVYLCKRGKSKDDGSLFNPTSLGTGSALGSVNLVDSIKWEAVKMIILMLTNIMSLIDDEDDDEDEGKPEQERPSTPEEREP